MDRNRLILMAFVSSAITLMVVALVAATWLNCAGTAPPL